MIKSNKFNENHFSEDTSPVAGEVKEEFWSLLCHIMKKEKDRTLG